MTVSLPGGYKISFDLHVTGGAVRVTAFPTYSAAYLGNKGRYTGVAGNPALYQTKSGTTTAATLDHITVVDASGDRVTGYAFVGADAESTDSNESISWKSNTNLSLISDLGNACSSGTALTGLGTPSVTCSGTSSGTKTGTAILAAKNPSTFSQTMVGGGLEGVAFGVLISKVQVNEVVVGRIDPSDAFHAVIGMSTGGTLATASTGTAASATTGEITVLTSEVGEQFTLSTRQTSGSSSNYTTSWSCTRNGATDPALPSGDAGTSASITLGVGDFDVCTITRTPRPVSVVLTKRARPPVDVNNDGLTDAGDTIDYAFTVTNTGVLPLSNITVADALVGPVSCPPVTLASGESVSCTASYTVTSADEAKGSVDNTATASGSPPGTTIRIMSPPASTATPVVAPAPRVSIAKVANASAGDTSPLQLGESIAYSYEVTNVGNVNLSSVAVDDPSVGRVTCPTPAAPGLSPGDSMICTADTPHLVNASDITAGSVTDTATATGTDPDGVTSPPSDPSTAQVALVAPDPRVSLNKTAMVSPSDDRDHAHLGDTITYSYRVTNIGNVDLTEVKVDDPSISAVTCPDLAAPGLAPGDSVTCTTQTPHTIDQTDIAAGAVTDTATATGTDQTGATSRPSHPSSVRVPVVSDPRVSIVKHAAVSPANDQDGAKLGDTIAYTYDVTNVGDVDLTEVKVDDPGVGAVTCPTPAAPGLAPGDSVSCAAQTPHTVDLADIAAGGVTDVATATGRDAAGITSSPSDPSTVHDPTAEDPRVSIVKHASVSPLADQQAAKLGDTIAYTYDLTNEGDVDLTQVKVDDPSVGSVTCPRPAPPGLEPHATITCTADTASTVDQSQVDAGEVVDSATATGTDAAGKTSPPSAPSSIHITTVHSDPAVDVVPHPETPAGNAPVVPGETIDYTFTVTNVGNTPLRAVTVTDPVIGVVVCPVPAPPGLAPGHSLKCVARRPLVVTAADVKTGKIIDHARATGIGVHTSVSAPSPLATVATRVETASQLRLIGTDLGRWVPGTRIPSPLHKVPGRPTTATSGPSIAIPALDIDAPLISTGAAGQPGTAVLSMPDKIDEVVWWDGTFIDGIHRLQVHAPAPGEPGVAIIAGHLDSAVLGPGAFYNLNKLRVGDTLSVVAPSGRRTLWKVSASPMKAPKDALPRALFSTSGPPRLALVTCGGPFDPETGHYVDNVIVWARQVGSSPASADR